MIELAEAKPDEIEDMIAETEDCITALSDYRFQLEGEHLDIKRAFNKLHKAKRKLRHASTLLDNQGHDDMAATIDDAIDDIEPTTAATATIAVRLQEEIDDTGDKIDELREQLATLHDASTHATIFTTHFDNDGSGGRSQ